MRAIEERMVMKLVLGRGILRAGKLDINHNISSML
jgi:hypothetical protein